MLNVIQRRVLGLGLAGLMTIAAALTSSALFTALEPGADLRPVGGAETLIDLIQGQESLLWSSLTGPVKTITVTGWPDVIEGNELGGALVIERPEDDIAGVIAFGEKPMSVEFELRG